MKCLVLAAGYGTRLYPLTKNTPKPLLTVGTKPIVEHALDRVRALKTDLLPSVSLPSGFSPSSLPDSSTSRGRGSFSSPASQASSPPVSEIYLVSNHHFYKNFSRWAKTYSYPVTVLDDHTSFNEERLGAIRDIQFALEQVAAAQAVSSDAMEDDWLVLAGDNLITFDMVPLVRLFYEKKSPVIAVKDIHDWPAMKKYGAILLDADQRIVDFEEKSLAPRSTLISTGAYLYNARSLRLIKRYIEEGNNPDAPGHFLQWLYQKIPCYGLVLEDPWFDIGDIDSYQAAHELMKSKTVTHAQ